MKKQLTTAILTATLLFTAHPTAQAASFTDVPTTHWAYEAVTDISNRGLINGYPDGTYQLNASVTRAQAAKIVALAINAKPSATFKPKYQDVSPAHGSYDHIRALTERGIFNDGDKFRPNEPLTRAQLAKILTLGYNIVIDDNDFIRFQDVIKINQYHGYITTLAELGITTTPPGGMFEPNADVSRAQIAAFIYRTMEFDAKREKGIIYYDKERRMYTDKPKPQPPVVTTPDNELQTIQLVNEQRKKSGVKELIHDKDLSAIAKAKAKDMATNNYFSHVSPTYGTVDQMLDTFKYEWTIYGENIAKAYTTPASAVEGWMNASERRENILNKTFTHIGSGYAVDKEGTAYWVHLFSQK